MLKSNATSGCQGRLDKELCHQLRLGRAGDLTDADLFCPSCRPGRGQVHIVDTGDDDHEQGDRGKNIDIGDAAKFFRLTLEVRMQVNGRDGLYPIMDLDIELS